MYTKKHESMRWNYNKINVLCI